jgi:hypothetical protein
MAEGKETVRFHVTAERMAAVEMGELLDLQDSPNDPRLLASFMSKFVTGADGEYLPEDEAIKAVRRVTIGQIKSAFEQVTGDMMETAVPNG